MTESAGNSSNRDWVESVLRTDLAQGDAVLGTIAPILRHLVATDDSSVFSDEIIARVRGVIADIARQLMDEMAAVSGNAERREPDPVKLEYLAAAIVALPAFLGHIHSLALEWQLTERLQGRLALDSVLSPLLQALIASPDPATSGLAMNLLAAQARFCQNQRRMKLPLCELPGDMLHGSLLAMRTVLGGSPEADGLAARAETVIRGRYDESCSRLGLTARLVTGMGGGAIAALSVTHAGPAIFFSALALASGQDRDLAVLSTNDRQHARFALSLRAAGLKPQAVAEQFLALHPEVTLPSDFEQLGADRAAAILAVSGCFVGA
jgi:hypothetical protein